MRRRSTTGKSPKKATTTPEPCSAEFSEDRRLSVMVGTSGEFGNPKISIGLTKNIKDDEDIQQATDAVYEELTAMLEEKAADMAEKFGVEDAGQPGYDSEVYEDDPEDDPEEGAEGGEEDDILPEDIQKMSKKDLLQLIEDEDLTDGVDTKAKLADLREEVIDLLFE